MKLIPWKKNGGLTTFRSELDDLFGRFFDTERDFPILDRLPEVFRRSFPAVDVSERDDTFRIRAELPGMDAKDIDVEIRGNHLVLSGERRWQEEEKEEELVRMESQYGAFHRSIPLPQGLRTNPEDVEAKYEKGVLEIVLKKIEPTPAAKIEVK